MAKTRKDGNMQVELWDIARVKEYERNPRCNEGAVDAVAKSIREFGFKVPVIVDAGGVLIAGHTRLKAARKLGMKQVPVIRADDLTPEQVQAFRIADNQTASIATWDYQLLPLELKDLQAADFDLDLLGFGADELARLLAPPGTEGLTDPDDVPDPPEEPVTQPGDLWLLGAYTTCPHCGEVNEL